MHQETVNRDNMTWCLSMGHENNGWGDLRPAGKGDHDVQRWYRPQQPAEYKLRKKRKAHLERIGERICPGGS